MRKSVLSILAVATLAASALTVDTAAARGHGGGGSFHSSGGSARSFSGGTVHSFGHMSGTTGTARAFSNNQSLRSFGGRQFSRRDFDRRNFGHHRHRRNFAFATFPFGVYDGFYNDYAYDYGYDYDCYRLRRVHTRWGWHWRRVYVCGYPY